MRAAKTYYKYLYYLLHYGGYKKIYNYILNKVEKKQKKVFLKSLPVNITIEPCNICNLSCPGCVTGVKHPGSIEPGMLSFEQFKYIFNQVKDYVFNISLYKWGEPFLNKDIFLMFNYASSNRCGTTVHSNFNIFNESMAEQAIKTKLTHIYLSIDGATQETYEKYRRGGDLGLVLKNIETLVKKKKEAKSKFPIITWKYLIFPHNSREIELARIKSKELGVDAFEAFRANLDNVSTFGAGKFYDLANECIRTFAADNCEALWDGIIIYPDGSVFPCCQSFRKKDIFGNIYNQPLSQIWNNNDYLALRKIIKTGKVGQDVRYPCCECQVIKDLKLRH
jgi:radical SAM protein with 4Fe4S-binding SPASM domain